MWVCSRGYRQFLITNFDWYPRNIYWKAIWQILMDQSGELESMKQAKFLFENIRIDGEREVTKVNRIFTASIDGWIS